MNIRRLSDLVSPQIGAVSGGRQPVLSEEDYIEGMADELPAMEEADYNRRMTEERMQMDRDARAQARTDSNISLGLETANLGVKAYPYLSKLAAGNAATAMAPTLAKTGTNIGLSEMAGVPGYGSSAGTTAASGGGGYLASMIPGIAGTVGARLGGDKFTREIGKLVGIVQDKKAQKIVGGTFKGAAAGAAAGSFLPGPGTLVGGLYGAISGFLSSL